MSMDFPRFSRNRGEIEGNLIWRRPMGGPLPNSNRGEEFHISRSISGPPHRGPDIILNSADPQPRRATKKRPPWPPMDSPRFREILEKSWKMLRRPMGGRVLNPNRR